MQIAETLVADYERISRHPGMSEALNRAADEVLGYVDHGDQRFTDAVNLVVNAALHFAAHPGVSLDEANEVNYDEPVDDVLAYLSDSYLSDS